MKMTFLATLGLAGLTIALVQAQTPAPVLIQAATPAPTAAIVAPAPAANVAADTPSMLQLLQEMQATNTETLKKQEAALATLDELEKAAEELKIFSKRG